MTRFLDWFAIAIVVSVILVVLFFVGKITWEAGPTAWGVLLGIALFIWALIRADDARLK
jgi:hypothetical protein